MKRSRKAALASSFLALAVLTGCAGTGYYARVGIGPPAPLVEERYGIAPGPDYVWTPGFYDWDAGNWAWRHGEWRRRPHAEDRWVAPSWEHHGREYRYRPGGWQHGNHFHH